MFAYKTKIRLYDTDAAGLVFFGSIFRILQEAYEELLWQASYEIQFLLGESHFSVPVAHAETDFILPLTAGDEIKIMIFLEDTGISSFKLYYEILNEDKEVAVKARTVHVTVDKEDMCKMDLPENFIEAIRALCL